MADNAGEDVKCRSCGQGGLQMILSLGKTPLANELLNDDELKDAEDTYPLDLVLCPNCQLVQITETVPPERLFRNYFYFSSFSQTVLDNARHLADRVIAMRRLGSRDLVVEIASNDGYLLQNYKAHDINVLGIEPAHNIAMQAINEGIPTVCEFFNAEVGKRLAGEGKTADVIHANNVVAHVADLHGVVQGIAEMLKKDGVAIIENHYVRDMIEHVEFDSIYHEHLCYFSLTSFKNLFATHGLKLVDAEHIPMHGGSLRVFFQRVDGPCSMELQGRERVEAMLEAEAAWGLDSLNFYKSFSQKVESLRHELVSLLKKIKSEGKRIAVYGASAKSTTLLNYFGIDGDTLDYVVDRSTVKQGHYTPGTHLQICSPEKLLTNKPDYVLLLTWNFADEILAQQAEFRNGGGKFIIPIPELKII